MSDNIRAQYTVDSSDPKYADATYSIEDFDDTSMGGISVYLDVEDGPSTLVASIEIGDLSDDDEMEEAVNSELRRAGLPPLGDIT